MYSRNIKETPKSIVHNGKINFGTYKKVTDKLEIRGLKLPFIGIPTPKIISNMRIKSRIAYMFNIGSYIGMVEFLDSKIFGLAEVIFWTKETGQKFSYHTMMATRKRFVPTNTQEAACISFRKTRYIKVNWSRKHKRHSLNFTVRGDKFRPAAKGSFIASFDTSKTPELLSVTPAPVSSKCSATWLIPMNITGGINLGKHRKDIKSLPNENGLALMAMNRTYLKLHSKSEMMCGLVNVDGKDIIFRFTNTNQDAINNDEYNDNILCVNANITPMPPVCITHPHGVNNKWVVQDTENMVDLAFTPISSNNRTLNILVIRNVYTTIYGTFEGVLLTQDGEKIVLKNCPGIVKKNLLRL